MRACAGPEPGSSMPHVARSVCRARRIGDANGNAAQTGGLARQVRQRMNRLGKPEHRARFCFFSKKKSLAGMRRFPIPSKSRFEWALTAVLSIRAAPKTLLQPPPFAGACATTPPQTTAFAARFASPRTSELPLARLCHHICKNQLPHNAPPCSPRWPMLAPTTPAETTAAQCPAILPCQPAQPKGKIELFFLY